MHISERGQITIPKPLRDRFGMHHNVEVEVTPTDEGLLIRKRTRGREAVARISGILSRGGNDAYPVDDTDAYIEEIRGR